MGVTFPIVRQLHRIRQTHRIRPRTTVREIPSHHRIKPMRQQSQPNRLSPRQNNKPNRIRKRHISITNSSHITIRGRRQSTQIRRKRHLSLITVQVITTRVTNKRQTSINTRIQRHHTNHIKRTKVNTHPYTHKLQLNRSRPTTGTKNITTRTNNGSHNLTISTATLHSSRSIRSKHTLNESHNLFTTGNTETIFYPAHVQLNHGTNELNHIHEYNNPTKKNNVHVHNHDNTPHLTTNDTLYLVYNTAKFTFDGTNHATHHTNIQTVKTTKFK